MERADKNSGSVAYRIPQELVDAMQSMQTGKLSFAKFRDELANTLYLDFRVARHIETWLDECESSGELPSHLHRVLVSDIQRICAEDVPTLIDTQMARAERESKRAPTISDEPSSPSEPTDAAINPMPADIAELASRRTVKVGDVLAERYEILQQADGGNMSTVFKAIDRKAAGSPDELCAIKLLLPEMASNGRALRALKDEYEKGALLNHPNVVRYRALERDGALIFVTMEWLQGETLATELNRTPGKPNTLAKTRQVISQVAAALDAVHHAGLVHADLKPGNLMVLPDGTIKLFDFGVARAFGALREQRIGFDAGVLAAATPAYASARVLDGDLPTPTDDYYSLACIAYRMLAGVRVFGSQNANQACADSTPIPVLESLSQDNFELLVPYLDHDSGQRPISSEQLLRALAPPVTKIESELPLMEGNGKFWLAAAAAVFFAGVLIVSRFNSSVGPNSSSVPSVASASTEASAATVSPENVDVAAQPDPRQVVPAAGANDPEVRTATAVGATPGASLPSDKPADAEEVATVAPVPTESSAAAVSLPPESATTSSLAAEAPRLRLSETGLGEVSQLRLQPNSGPVDIWLDGFDLSDLTSVRVYLQPGSAELPHTLSLDSPSTGQVGSRLPLQVQVTPYGANGLAMHRDYRLVVASEAPTPAILGALDILVINPALESLASTAGENLIGFTTSEIAVAESAGVARVTLVRMNPDANTWRGQVVVSSRGATESEDFFGPASTTLTFAPGENSQTLLLPLVNDGISEADEIFYLDILGDNLAPGLSQTIAITITDDDGGFAAP